jgi:hypothetical protein
MLYVYCRQSRGLPAEAWAPYKDGGQLETESEYAAMLTAEQVLSRLNQMRKDYEPDEEEYQALHHAMLFCSYQMALFQKYLQEAAGRDNEEDS